MTGIGPSTGEARESRAKGAKPLPTAAEAMTVALKGGRGGMST
jgi:hypothetical protein